jgi:phosphate:Na+ symporter
MFFAFMLVSNKKKKYNNLGEFLMGFALLFLGLTTLRETSTVLLDNEPVRHFLGTLTEWGGFSILLFMVAGACMTLMLQSSAATMAITMVLVANGYIPFEMAAAMVLGENIGTTITSNIAASVANVSAKRTARAHLLFNVFGVFWVCCLFHPFLGLLGNVVELFGFPNPAATDFAAADEATRAALVASLPYSVATLHTLFNIINTCILVWFIPVIVKIVTWMVPNPKEGNEVFRLKYIGAGTLGTADMALSSVKMELVRYGDLCRRDLVYIREAISAKSQEEFEKANEKLIKYEEITDHMEHEIAAYLNEATRIEMSHDAVTRVRSFYRIIGEMESLGDSGESIGKILSRAWAHSQKFTDDMLRKLDRLCTLVDNAYAAMHENLDTPLVQLESITNAEEAEENVNAYRDSLREEHLSNVEKSNYPYETGAFYMDVVNSLEKMGDFIINISQAQISAKPGR